jgi:sugar/nucleoside kinase (ribokinase family)
MPLVLVIGDVMTDVIVKPDGPIAVGADRRALIWALQGGAGANQACWLAAEGVDVRFAARVGAGDRARQKLALAAYGVDARLAADEVVPSGTLITLLAPDGERSFLTDRAANLNLARSDLSDSLLGGVDLVHISGYAFFEAGPRAAVLDFLAEVKRRKIPFSVDPASYSFLQEVGPSSFLEWTRGARFFFPNEDEAATLTDQGDAGSQLEALLRTYEVVLLKRGGKGAIGAEAKIGARLSSPAKRIAAIDTSGAGDAFLGGFLGGYLRGQGLEAALARGVELGSQAVTQLGARPPVSARQA